MRRLAVLAVLVAGCGFNPHGEPDAAGGGDDDAQATDADPGDGADPDAATLDAAMIDAAMIDAAMTDMALPTDAPADAPTDARPSCPAGYTITVTGSTSKYRLGTLLVSLGTANSDCNDDLTGRTHLATFENNDLDATMVASNADNNAQVYLGGVCLVSSGQNPCDLTANWTWIAGGGAISSMLWANGEPTGNLTRSYAGRSGGNWVMFASAGTIPRTYLCECEP